MATTVTVDTFKVRFPEFISIENCRIELFLADAVLGVNEAFWGDKYDLGIAYLAAHFLTLSEKGATGGKGAVGAVSSRSVDGSSVSYAVPTPGTAQENFLSATVYGQRFLAMMKTLGVVANVI